MAIERIESKMEGVTVKERERWMFLGNQNCALLLIDMFITANISNDFSDCLHSRIAFWQTNFVQSNCANNTPPLSLSLNLFLSVCVSFALPLQNSSCAYLSKPFRRENRKKCTYKAKAKENCCMRLEAQQMCKVFLARWRNRTVESAGKYGTRKTAAAAASS